MARTCKNCGNAVDAQTRDGRQVKACLLRNAAIPGEEYSCGDHRFGAPYTCAFCGNYLAKGGIITPFEGDYKLACEQCYQKIVIMEEQAPKEANNGN